LDCACLFWRFVQRNRCQPCFGKLEFAIGPPADSLYLIKREQAYSAHYGAARGATIAVVAECAFAANPAGFGPEAARAAMTNFTVSEGLQLSLFASEPMVRKSHRYGCGRAGPSVITEVSIIARASQKWGVLQAEGIAL